MIEKVWDEESPIPSPVMLANQVLRKVKLAPKRGWSEDSQGSPPRSPEPEIPVPPTRKSKKNTTKVIVVITVHIEQKCLSLRQIIDIISLI